MADDPLTDSTFALSPDTDTTTQLILLHASNHNLEFLKPLLRIPGNASVQDSETGMTPLHAAIAACGPAKSQPQSQNALAQDGAEGTPQDETSPAEGEEGEEEVDLNKAKEVIRELFLSGAIWNDLDTNNETPGCVAWRLGRRELYEMCVEAGVRAEMLLGIMGGYEELESGDEEGDDEEEGESVDTKSGKEEGNGNGNGEETTNGTTHEEQDTTQQEDEEKRDVNSEDYLKSELKFEDDKLLDADANGVMMAWETDIMRRTADLLLPDSSPGARILNIGFGMGIIDRMFRDTKPLSHHIIEAHPAVLHKLQEPDSDFGTQWQNSAPSGATYKIHAGRWQDIVPTLLEADEVFDVIYFDTFGEDYTALKLFFTEFIPGLLTSNGKFGFFNGLGADRRVCYDVYCRVVELDLCDAGLDVAWTDVPVQELGEEGEGEWKGVRRRYWTLDMYKLPVCTFFG
jgi:protein arginine N-methyltransferase 2